MNTKIEVTAMIEPRHIAKVIERLEQIGAEITSSTLVQEDPKQEETRRLS